MNERVPAQVPAALAPEPIKHAAVLGPVKATPFGWSRKKRPTLTALRAAAREIYGRGETMLRRGSNKRMNQLTGVLIIHR